MSRRLLFTSLFLLMLRRPPRSTRTDTLFPYTTLFRSINTKAVAVFGQATYEIAEDLRLTLGARYSTEKKKALDNFPFDVVNPFDPNTSAALVLHPPAGQISLPGQKSFKRSEEGSVGKECDSMCR